MKEKRIQTKYEGISKHFGQVLPQALLSGEVFPDRSAGKIVDSTECRKAFVRANHKNPFSKERGAWLPLFVATKAKVYAVLRIPSRSF